MTNHWVDIKNANVVMVMGGNAAEAHPVGFRWAMEAKNNNDATSIVVDPRFTRTASVADIYAPIRSGTDITFLSGVLRYLIENDKINAEYVSITPTPACWCVMILLSKTVCSAATTLKNGNTINRPELSVR